MMEGTKEGHDGHEKSQLYLYILSLFLQSIPYFILLNECDKGTEGSLVCCHENKINYCDDQSLVDW